jgi:hypothetical protein
MRKVPFGRADILLPKKDHDKWAVVACDQYTSQPEYWVKTAEITDGYPSTLNITLPEVYLEDENVNERIENINKTMNGYLENGTFNEYKDAMIYVERTLDSGKVRRGIVGAVDLEEYDYNKGSVTITRATEGTVLERIPPRVAIRRGAAIEMPHIMILIDDKDRSVVEPIAAKAESYKQAYDFDLMANSGHVTGYFVEESDFDKINEALNALCADGVMQEKYGVDAPALLFAIGDGNHSLASAKALYEEIKAEIGAEKAANHPARYALCEIVNLHDEALEFEPIYRVAFGVDRAEFVRELEAHLDACNGDGEAQSFELVIGEESKTVRCERPTAQLPVGTLQTFLDAYVKNHEGVVIDYIHGIESTKTLSKKENAVGMLFDGMSKDMLFKTVICDGALPRKTFSMGHAADKRFYIECRKIR